MGTFVIDSGAGPLRGGDSGLRILVADDDPLSFEAVRVASEPGWIRGSQCEDRAGSICAGGSGKATSDRDGHNVAGNEPVGGSAGIEAEGEYKANSGHSHLRELRSCRACGSMECGRS